MKKKLKLILIVLGVSCIGAYFIMNFLCKLSVKCENCTQTSNTKEQSKENGFYLMNYKPLKKEVNLKNHDEKITFKEVWVESQWFYNSDNCLNTKLEKQNGFNIVFEFKKSNKDKFLFSLTPTIKENIDITNSGMMETKKEIRLNELPDTLWIQIHEKNPKLELGWKKELTGELIGFVKQQTNYNNVYN
jgi:hypothetical protein